MMKRTDESRVFSRRSGQSSFKRVKVKGARGTFVWPLIFLAIICGKIRDPFKVMCLGMAG